MDELVSALHPLLRAPLRSASLHRLRLMRGVFGDRTLGELSLPERLERAARGLVALEARR